MVYGKIYIHTETADSINAKAQSKADESRVNRGWKREQRRHDDSETIPNSPPNGGTPSFLHVQRYFHYKLRDPLAKRGKDTLLSVPGRTIDIPSA